MNLLRFSTFLVIFIFFTAAPTLLKAVERGERPTHEPDVETPAQRKERERLQKAADAARVIEERARAERIRAEKRSLEAVNTTLAKETAFTDRIQNRIDAAEEALRISREKMQTDVREAYLYAEAATKIAEMGLTLYQNASSLAPNTNQPFEPGSTPVAGWTTITAAAAVDRLKQGLDKYRSFEEFTIRDANNEYRNEINSLKGKLKAYVERNIAPLRARQAALQTSLSTRNPNNTASTEHENADASSTKVSDTADAHADKLRERVEKEKAAKEAKDKEAKNKEAKDKEAKDKEAKDKETKDKDKSKPTEMRPPA